ncbi:MAG: hypothetical protein HQK91_03605 [Nitrospirae bacterium]|nr:hypothetical protein [Nitrospirota bacterium]
MNEFEQACIHYYNHNICEYLSIAMYEEFVEKVCKVASRYEKCPFLLIAKK